MAKLNVEQRLARNVAKLRTEQKLSQRGLGRRAGLSGAYVNQIESGVRSQPTLETISKLAAALDTTMLELLGGK